MRGTALIPTTIAWCWFYAVGSLLLAIIPWFNEPLQLTGSGLLAAPGIGIGLGGLVAGLASGDFIRSGLVPAGAIGMAISLVLLGLLPLSLITTIVLLVTTGVFAGCYLVPVLAMLQHIPEADFRARAVGTANFMTYVAMSVSAILFAVAASFFGAHVTIWFLVCGGMMTIVAGWSWRHRKELAMGASSSSFSSVAGPSK
jgi:acyl-[acyl-carrier-protein]-phospholipid O-acyltransferase/long-chain-fatty-acid--[acyl-carrier-protein] ligase